MEKYYFYIFLSIALLAGLIVGLIISLWIRFSGKKNFEMWSERALRLGMDYEGGNLVGNYQGLNYWIYPASYSDEDRIAYPRIEMKIGNPHQVKISLLQPTIFHFIRETFWFGFGGDEIGYAEFDESFYLSSKPKNLAARILKSSELSSRLVDLNRKYPLRLKLSGDIFYIEVKGFEYSMECLKPFLDIAYDFKQSVEQAISYYPSF